MPEPRYEDGVLRRAGQLQWRGRDEQQCSMCANWDKTMRLARVGRSRGTGKLTAGGRSHESPGLVQTEQVQMRRPGGSTGQEGEAAHLHSRERIFDAGAGENGQVTRHRPFSQLWATVSPMRKRGGKATLKAWTSAWPRTKLPLCYQSGNLGSSPSDGAGEAAVSSRGPISLKMEK